MVNSLKLSMCGALSTAALLGYTATANAQELPPSAYNPPPQADRPTENPSPKSADQERRAKNLVYVELLGNGGLYSINYERMFGNDLSLRLGGSYTTLSVSGSGGSSARASLVTAPVLVNYFVGGRNHKAEFGAGATFFYLSGETSDGSGVSSSGSGATVVGTGVVGYRYSPADGGFVFRVGFTPMVGRSGFMPWGGVSFGGTF